MNTNPSTVLSTYGPLLATAAGLVLALLFLSSGLRLIFRLVRGALFGLRWWTDGLPAMAVGAAIVASIALAPGPYLRLLEFVRRVAMLLALDLPRFAVETSRRVAGCLGSQAVETACLDQAVYPPVDGLLRNALPPLFEPLAVRDDIGRALLILGVGLGLAWLLGAAAPGGGARRPVFASRQPRERLLPVLLAMLGAGYLGLTAIIAVPSFRDETIDLERQLATLKAELDGVDHAIEVPAPPIERREQILKTVGRLAELDPALIFGPAQTAAATNSPASLPRPASDLDKQFRIALFTGLRQSLERTTGAARLLARFDQEAAARGAGAMETWVNERANDIQRHFMQTNRGRIGLRATERHRDALVSEFRFSLADLRADLDACEKTMAAAAADLAADTDHLWRAFEPIRMGQQPNIEQVAMLQRDAPIAERLQASCGLHRPTADRLPGRPGLQEGLGIFGLAAAWLLETESRELALITGLIGFGMLGALSAAFIRKDFAEDAAGRGVPLIPIIVRGAAAAFLVFLVVMGGIAVFTRAEPAPNAYAVFFACFVAAVFSEDVWAWARRAQAERLKSAVAAGAVAGAESGAAAGAAAAAMARGGMGPPPGSPEARSTEAGPGEGARGPGVA